MRVRRKFRAHCHDSLDSYLSESDPETGLPTIDVLIAYMGQGWDISVGVNCVQPGEPPGNGETTKPTLGGIEVVSA